MEQLAQLDSTTWVIRSSDTVHYYTLKIMAEDAGQTTITCTCAGHYYRDEGRHSKMLVSKLEDAIQDKRLNIIEPVS